MLDSNLYPYLADFYYAKQTEIKYHYILKDATPGFMPPEFLRDFMSNQNSFEIDVYAFGMTMFILVAQLNPFINMNQDNIIQNVKNGFMPQFHKNIGKNWKDLILKCLDQNPKKRPSFKEIRSLLESDIFVNDTINVKAFNRYKDIFIKFKSNI